MQSYIKLNHKNPITIKSNVLLLDYQFTILRYIL